MSTSVLKGIFILTLYTMALLSVLMDSKKSYLKHIFFVASVTSIIIYFIAGKLLMYRETPAHKKPPASSAEQHWEDPGPYHVAYPRNYRFIMDDTPTCRTTTPFLILVVPVAPSDVEKRNIIRQTWGNEKLVLGQQVETVFLVGLPGGKEARQQQEKLQQENQQHHDLIQNNFLDSYHNLTIKTMVMLEWLAAHCDEASFVMKIDSDVFLHVPNVVKLLLDPSTANQNYITGLVWWHGPVLRNPFIKFYMPRSVIAESEYPPYPLGLGYIMSLDLPGKILGVSPQVKPIYIEDAYLGMCLKRLGISPTDPPERTMFLVNPTHPLSSCSLSKVIASTTTGISQMKSYCERVRQGVHC